MTHRQRRLLQVGSGVLLGLVVTGLLVVPNNRVDPPPTLGADVALVNSRGEPTTLAAFQGGWTLLFFGFTHCPDVCPVTLERIAAGLRHLEQEGQLTDQAITIALVTVDPERDTPAVLADYLAPYGPRYVGLTGTADNLAVLTDAYGIVVEPAKDAVASDPSEHGAHTGAAAAGSEIAHTARVHVLDPKGRWIGEIPPWPGAKDMGEAIQSMLSEGSNP